MATASQTAGTMRAWRTHEYGPPLEALQLDTVAIPVPDAGEVRVRVQAIPLNLNDLERITGGNMMVEPELPYSPGMEVMGIVDACGDGVEQRLGGRVVATTKGAHGGFAEYAICPAVSAFDMPDDIADHRVHLVALDEVDDRSHDLFSDATGCKVPSHCGLHELRHVVSCVREQHATELDVGEGHLARHHERLVGHSLVRGESHHEVAAVVGSAFQ